MRCILACDLKGGIVVKGVRGERHRYGPIAASSRIVDTSSPAGVIAEIKPAETYIADLDRITGTGDHLSTIRELSGMTRTMADIGVAGVDDLAIGCTVAHTVVIGTETASLKVIEQCQGPRTIVSLDMKHGQILCRDTALALEPLEALRTFNGLEMGAVILLDIGRVGSGEGIDARFVETAVSTCRHPVIVGGGVRDISDLELLEKIGAAGAIVASAVHDGRIPAGRLRD